MKSELLVSMLLKLLTPSEHSVMPICPAGLVHRTDANHAKEWMRSQVLIGRWLLGESERRPPSASIAHLLLSRVCHAPHPRPKKRFGSTALLPSTLLKAGVLLIFNLKDMAHRILPSSARGR